VRVTVRQAGADSYLFKPLRLADFSNIWQFVMQQRCHKLLAERREMRYLRAQQLARVKQLQAEKLRAVALADADREKAQRERAEAEAARQKAEQEAELDRHRDEMQKEIMRLLHQQVRRATAPAVGMAACVASCVRCLQDVCRGGVRASRASRARFSIRCASIGCSRACATT
jgi:hypothetical protein